MSNLADWTYESKYTILTASLELKERFRAAARAQQRGRRGGYHRDGDEKIEQMAALAWGVRAQEVCERADVLIEEGVPNEEVRDILLGSSLRVGTAPLRPTEEARE